MAAFTELPPAGTSGRKQCMRYFFEIAYHGKQYAGWQTQVNATGVQTVLEKCLSQLFRKPVAIVGSGRTDAGVHCRQQFFHADLDESVDIRQLHARLNSFLPADIAIHSITPVKDDAHARYSATERMYEYLVTLRKDPLLQGLAFPHYKPLDIKTMNTAATLLVGTHDFACFSKVKTDVTHFMCDVKEATWRQESHLLTFRIAANRFLRGMVRAVVGTLLDVGQGKISVEDFAAILESKDRKKAGANVAAMGLYLMRVHYPPDLFINNKQKA